MKLIPWEEVAVQLESQERALFEAAFAGARSKHDLVDLTIYGRRYMVAPTGKVWLILEAAAPQETRA